MMAPKRKRSAATGRAAGLSTAGDSMVVVDSGHRARSPWRGYMNEGRRVSVLVLDVDTTSQRIEF
jgi:hypothetical protein